MLATFFKEIPDGPLISGYPKRPESWPILVCGQPHGGTTLMLSLLAASRWAVGVPMQTGAFKGPKGPGQWFDERLNRKWLPKLFNKNPDAVRWVEKSPDHAAYIDAIDEAFGSRVFFVCMIRDGRNVLTSNLKAPHDPLRENEKRAFRDAQRNFNKYGKAAFDAPVSHPDNAILVRYEDLTLNPKSELKRVCDFIKLDIQADFWRDWETDRLFCGENRDDFENKRIKRGPITSDPNRWKRKKFTKIVSLFMSDEKTRALMKTMGYLK